MTERLKVYLISLMLRKVDSVNIIYQERVVLAIDANYFVDEICSFILKSLHEECLIRRIALTDTNLLKLLSPEFCLERANFYLDFMGILETQESKEIAFLVNS